MSLLDKEEVQDICGHTALRARKWSGFICKRVSEDTTLSCYVGLLKKEEEERRMPNQDFFKINYIHALINANCAGTRLYR